MLSSEMKKPSGVALSMQKGEDKESSHDTWHYVSQLTLAEAMPAAVICDVF